MKRWLTLLSCFFLTIASTAQLPCVPASNAPGRCSSVGGNYWEAFYNPARLSREEQKEGRIFYQNRFFTPELSTVGISYAQPLPWFTGGVALSYFGYDVYSEMMTSLSIARRYGAFRLGIAMDSYSVYITQDNKYHFTMTGEIGVQLAVNSEWEIALHLFNPVYSKIKISEQSTLPVFLTIGSDYHPVESCHILCELTQFSSDDVRIGSGVQYDFYSQFALNLGAYYHNWIIPTLGVILHCNDYGLYLNCEWHPILGVSSLISLELDL